MSTNTRVTGLLKRFDLLDRLVENYDELSVADIDYAKVNEKVESFRHDSLNYLTQALKQNS